MSRKSRGRPLVMVGVEVLLCVGNDLSVGRVIHRFDTKNALLDCVVILVNVSDEIELGCGRTHDQDGFGTIHRSSYLVKVSLGIIRVLLCTFRPMGMLTVVNIVSRSGHSHFIDLIPIEVKNASFFVIDPDGYLLNHD